MKISKKIQALPAFRKGVQAASYKLRSVDKDIVTKATRIKAFAQFVEQMRDNKLYFITCNTTLIKAKSMFDYGNLTTSATLWEYNDETESIISNTAFRNGLFLGMGITFCLTLAIMGVYAWLLT